MGLLLSFILNLMLMLIIIFVISFFLMVLLNPTASSKEIFNYWIKNYKEN